MAAVTAITRPEASLADATGIGCDATASLHAPWLLAPGILSDRVRYAREGRHRDGNAPLGAH